MAGKAWGCKTVGHVGELAGRIDDDVFGTGIRIRKRRRRQRPQRAACRVDGITVEIIGPVTGYVGELARRIDRHVNGIDTRSKGLSRQRLQRAASRVDGIGRNRVGAIVGDIGELARRANRQGVSPAPALNGEPVTGVSAPLVALMV